MGTLHVKLYVWPPAEGMPSMSPYCIKIIRALEHFGIAHKTKIVGIKLPQWARTGRLPAAEITLASGEVLHVEDSSNIFRALAEKAGIPLYPSDPFERSEVLLLEDWSDEALTVLGPYYRWGVLANFRDFSSRVYGKLPWMIRTFGIPRVRADFMKEFKARGLLSMTEAERQLRWSDALAIVRARLDRSPWLVGSRPTAADFSVYGILRTALASPIPEIQPSIQREAKICDWMKRLEESRAH